MPPEHLLAVAQGGEADDNDERSDLYSTGVILYELLTGRHPFGPVPEKTAEDWSLRMLEKQGFGAPSIRALNPKVDAEFAKIIHKCLEFELEDRFASAGEIVDRLRPRSAPVVKPRRRKVLLGAALAGMAAVCMLAFAFLWNRPSETPSPKALAEESIRLMQWDRAVEHLNKAIAAEPNQGDLRLARAHAYRHWGETDESKRLFAANDFEKADELAPSGLTKAWAGFMHHLQKSDRLASNFYERALAADFRTSALWNNLGLLYKQRGDYDRAESAFNSALEHDANEAAVYRNRALLFLERSLQADGDESAKWLTRGSQDAQTALRLRPASGQLHFDAASLLAQQAKTNPDLIEPAVDHLTQAVQLGFGPQNFADDKLFEKLEANPRFLALRNGPQVPRANLRAAAVLPPA